MFDESGYVKLFLEDAEEQIQTLNRSLLAMEKNPDERSILDELFRAAHNLKGGSATLGFTSMQRLTHEMENVLDELRSGKIIVSRELADCLFQCLDTLNLIVEQITAGGKGEADVELQCEKLREFLRQAEPSAASEEAPAEAMVELAHILKNLSEYDRLVIGEEFALHREVYEVIIYMSEDASMRSARAFVLLNNLKNAGEILKTYPDLNNADAADAHVDFHFLISTEEPVEQLRDRIGGSEIEFVEIVPATIFVSAAEIQALGKAAAAETVQDAQIPGERAPDEAVEPVAAPAQKAKPKSAPDGNIPKPAAQAAAARSISTVRVDTDRLDALMNLVGELVINRTRLAQVRKDIASIEDEAAETRTLPPETAQKLKAINSEFDLAYQQMGRITGELQGRVMQIRMLPISNVFARFERVVRDLAGQMGRLVNLEISGQDTELDKTVTEVIGDPLMHIVRNAIAHGIEPAAERAAAGKPAEGLLSMRACHEGNHVIIEIADDGRGIDPQRMKETAVRLGIITPERAEKLTDREAVRLIFTPAFSTTENADSVSGRGVGMDVVARNIERLNGMIDIQTVPGEGAKFIIRIPLTLATIQALLVGVSGETFAVPLVNIVEAVRIHPGDIEKIEGREVTFIRNSVVSLLRMDAVLGLPQTPDDGKRFLYVVIVGLAEKRVGLIVHELLGRQEIVIKSISEYFSSLPAIAGASILGDGRVSLILDVYSLIGMGVEHINREVESRRHKAAASQA